MAINISASGRGSLGLDLTGGGQTSPGTPAFWTFVLFAILVVGLIAIAHSLR